MKDLTIIIPVFNGVKTINEVLGHLMPLARSGIAIKISDNCSTDGTQRILKSFQNEPNVYLFFQDKNIQGDNVRFLLSQVKTKWVLPVGADDYLVSGQKLMSQLSILNEQPDYVGFSLRSRFIYPNGLVDDRTNRPIEGQRSFRLLKFLFFVGCNSRYYGIIQTRLLADHYPTENYFANDIVLTANILQHGNWGYLPQIELHRELGTSSDPIRLRRGYGRSRLMALIPETLPEGNFEVMPLVRHSHFLRHFCCTADISTRL